MPLYVIPLPNFDPVLVHLGPIPVRWYALAYIAGILLGWLYVRALIRAPRLWGGTVPMTTIDYDDFILWVTIGIIAGGRIGYVLFYNPIYFAQHPLQSLYLWQGGMSFHGGVLGCVVAVVLFARHRGLPTLSLGDLTCAAAPIGLFFGRIANFINGELWGRPTDVPWAVVFPRGRTGAASPKPAVRGRPRRHRVVCSAGGARSFGRTATARIDHWHLRPWLWGGAFHLRTVSSTGCPAWFSLGRPHDGNAAIHSIDSWQWPVASAISTRSAYCSSVHPTAPWNTFLLMVILIWIQAGFAMVILSAAIKGYPDRGSWRLPASTASPRSRCSANVTLPSIRPCRRSSSSAPSPSAR